MRIKKTFINVKLPSSIPELGSKLEPGLAAEPSKKPSEQRIEIRKNSINIGQHLIVKDQKFWVQALPIHSQLTLLKVISHRSNSHIRHSESPLKFRRYVESVLDSRSGRSSRSHSHHESLIYMPKNIMYKPKRTQYAKSKLLPIIRK